MHAPRRVPRGISLIEAVVALAVMAFGMLAYVGLQSSLRFNGDVSKQRSEAVRIAQQDIEEWRAYAFVETTPGRTAYDDLAAGQLNPPSVIVGDNGSFTLQRTVVDAAATTDPKLIGAAPRMKTLTVDVSWQDRHGEAQSVRLSTTITASPPELAGTLAIPGSGAARGRDAAIPVGAKNLGQIQAGGPSVSAYKPPGAAGATTVFVFDNTTGVIVGVCNGVSRSQSRLRTSDVQNCSNNANGLPLSGFVRFFTGSSLAPTAADAENPTSFALNLAVDLTLTSTNHPTPAYLCYADAPSMPTTSTAVPYFCAIFFQAGVTNPSWSGTSTLRPVAFNPTTAVPAPTPWLIADDNLLDARIDRFRVCRYTPAANDTQPVPNAQHPRNYVNVGAGEALSNQNFLVISAGDGTNVFQCPIDSAVTPLPANPTASDLINANTLVHQP